MYFLTDIPDKTVWDMYYEFLTIIFGVDFPPVIAYICFVSFLLFIFGILIWIFRVIFRGFY
ncbi:hypothetical protein [Spiroplasma melliferum]|uniref:Membrane protein n=2 Tax=Spiroplasma melliferum TaxID=2134 RepID=A0AAI9T3U4_SPIME|nr:hypothetical protein [Spiroplasma melliferum]ELL44359.1 plectrovirus SVTS2 ORF 13 uncharacterized protein [Spiroplasma melliferum IPMB4A]KAI92762.1 membrane protein [Spiroplasma melliferum KC3]QCO24391.1 Spiroplasmavirus-related protein [Spiroplasma melliferum]